MARKFFFVCAGMLMLALSYHFGANTAIAQAGSPISGFTGSGVPGVAGGALYVMTINGDVYFKAPENMGGAPRLLGNFWAGATPAVQESWGQVKARYR